MFEPHSLSMDEQHASGFEAERKCPSNLKGHSLLIHFFASIACTNIPSCIAFSDGSHPNKRLVRVHIARQSLIIVRYFHWRGCFGFPITKVRGNSHHRWGWSWL